ncbi:pyridoxal phosphate-dependent aminotransferase [Lentibacillus sp. CBA3610]|uniref:pyridoxal phosphate-dependent aminotransferase n=1 Tax=Lentibacillus sp. CBA3610 TaxID=2518176 RepID=UPI0015953875|nr:pyridoxal phosphate-dependent aminotransferase [Lentibacillus sp. CBA3610]QKY69186.1 pyridoxal phosphate-dependent aminotransferase [Lentibacillus sp. CBA3610]
MELANRVKTLTPSATLAITAKAKELKSQGYDVIGLGAGEPDFNTPEYILKAAEDAMRNGFTKYTPAGGIPELKQAIINKFQRDNGLTYNSDEVIVTTGAKHALFTLFQVLLNKGDEVIVPAPYWVSYPEQVKLAEGEPVFIEAKEQNGFKLTPEQLKSAITSRTKAVIINSPSNPTGMMYNQQELKELGDVCLDNDILIVSDEIYEKLIYTNDKHVSVAEISEQLKANTIIINGVSKSHAMTGWRIGYAAGSSDIIKPMTSLASHSTSNPTSIAQHAALAAYSSNEDPNAEMRDIFSERLDELHSLLNDIPGISCMKPKGAFYVFPNVQEAVRQNGFDSVDEWVKALLEEEKVALVPGTGFGAPENVRLSYATSLDALKEAAKRINRFVLNHQS